MYPIDVSAVRRYAISEEGYFQRDLLPGQESPNWTATFCPDGLINGRLVGAIVENGEWIGGCWQGDPEPEVTREQVEQARLMAYANPITGSNRHFIEALCLDSAGDIQGAKAARAAGILRYEQIKAEIPWPPTEPQ